LNEERLLSVLTSAEQEKLNVLLRKLIAGLWDPDHEVDLGGKAAGNAARARPPLHAANPCAC
jgi:hypothetical protein